ncbi:DUF1835 domain-containing protein [Roseomonas hellenica]|uniref:DUF1835 domain-containing protein n=1 Tax=Plastoroseomonas hellenica TaxID=2687306 RepID=A0ABS5ETI4_9PROT|nr:DUF3658 domain-containing protein [Plastoroseomonas hellenica]MBR0663594.1 DUF1835 domain-containing protein [Plastoroseomonas hellenica]
MPREDFVGRWIAGSDWNWGETETIEIEIVGGLLVVRAIDDSNGELADIRDLQYGEDEVRFAAHWLSRQPTLYHLLRSDERLVVHRKFSETECLTRDVNADGTQKWCSGVLHIAPGPSAAGALRAAVRSSGRTDRVLGFQDDLSCGPIDSEDDSQRARWWASVHDDPDIESDIDDFWGRVASTPDRLIVWFARHSASEHAFFLALADRLGDRPYDIIDVTGLRIPITRPGSEPELSPPKQAVALMAVEELASLFGTERAMTSEDREDAAQRWRRLQSENAPFRIVTDAGLASAPADVFDAWILEQATKDWRGSLRVVHDAMGYNAEPYFQVGDVMLRRRLAALCEQGRLLAHGDTSNMWSCEVRLPD